MGEFVGLVAVVLLFGGIPAALVIIYYFARNAKHTERMALIEKGADPSVYMKEDPPYYSALMWGLFIFGIGLGALLGYIFSVFTPMEQEVMMPTLSVIFGGLGLIGFYIYRRKAGTTAAA